MGYDRTVAVSISTSTKGRSELVQIDFTITATFARLGAHAYLLLAGLASLASLLTHETIITASSVSLSRPGLNRRMAAGCIDKGIVANSQGAPADSAVPAVERMIDDAFPRKRSSARL